MEIRRLLQHSRIALRALSGVALFAAPAGVAALAVSAAVQAQVVRQDAFAVSGVTVDVSASDANVARDRAVAQAQRKAWDELFKQLLPPGAKPPAISDVDLGRAVQNFSVDDERLSPGRYAATMTVRFAPEPVRKAMADSGATAYVEPSTRPLVLLPVTVRPDGAPVLWDDRTAWRSAWEAWEPKPGALAPLTVPDGELSDVAAVSAQEASAGDAAAFAKIAGQHGAGGVAVVKTTLPADGAATAQGMRVDVTLATVDGVRGSKTVAVRADPADRPEDLLSRAVAFSAAAIDELWRENHTVSAGPQQTLTAVVALNSLSDWISARQKLAQLGGGVRVDMTSLTRNAANVVISHRGGATELQERLARQNLILRQEPGGWVIAAPPPSLVPAPVVQTTPDPVPPPARP